MRRHHSQRACLQRQALCLHHGGKRSAGIALLCCGSQHNEQGPAQATRARRPCRARACSELSTASSARKAALRSAATGLASAVAASRRSSVCAAGDGAWPRPPAAAAAAASASALPASASDCTQAAEGTPYKLGLG